MPNSNLDKPFVIYGLACPVNGRIRYVGVTSRLPEQRFHEHWHKDSIKTETHFGRWLRKVKRTGQKPLLIILERGFAKAPADWQTAEQRWIASLPKEQLVNSTKGGEGIIILNNAAGRALCKLRSWQASHRTEEHRNKISKSAIERNKDPKYRNNMSQKTSARMADPKVRAKYSATTKKQMASKAMRQHLSDCTKKHMACPKNKKHQSKAMKKYWSKNHSLQMERLTSPAAIAKHKKTSARQWSAVKAAGCRTLKEYASLSRIGASK